MVPVVREELSGVELQKINGKRVFCGLLLFFYCCCLLLLTGCDEPFQPLQENGLAPFSIYGYLDASADTQWLRVTPLREQLDTPAEIPDMHVTLTDLESGNSDVMNDSLFRLIQGFNALNMWSAMDIEPGRTYCVRAERPDEAFSQVTVTIPEDFPTPVLRTIGLHKSSGDLFLKDLERVADVQTIWRIEGDIFAIPYRFRVRNYDPAGYDYIVNLSALYDVKQMFVDAPPPWPQDILQRDDVQRQVFIASAGPEWIEDIASLDDLVYALPEELSNVENGIGYVVGIVSKTIPFESCFDEQGEITGCPMEKPFFR